MPPGGLSDYSTLNEATGSWLKILTKIEGLNALRQIVVQRCSISGSITIVSIKAFAFLTTVLEFLGYAFVDVHGALRCKLLLPSRLALRIERGLNRLPVGIISDTNRRADKKNTENHH